MAYIIKNQIKERYLIGIEGMNPSGPPSGVWGEYSKAIPFNEKIARELSGELNKIYHETSGMHLETIVEEINWERR